MKKLIIRIICLFLISCFIARVIYVNRYSRLPVENEIKQGESCLYYGVNYTIKEAKLYEKNNFFYLYPELVDYENKELEYKILLVGVELEKYEESPTVTDGIWLQYGYCITSFSPFMYVDMNQELYQGTLKSGDIINIPFEIYKDNLTDEHWENLNGLNMHLSIGTYPEKNKLLITEIEYE